jgi:hypothetical protein
MMTSRWKLPASLAVTAWLLCVSTASAAPLTFSFDLLPAGGAISGEAGETIGWGYTINNESDSWLEIFSLNADPFQYAAPDSSIFDFPILAPGATATVSYDAAAVAGLFQLTWDAAAPVGFTNIGTFVLLGQFYDADPFGGGNLLGETFEQSAPYSTTVTAAAPVPEPGTLLLMGTGAAGLWLRRRIARVAARHS